MTSKAKTPKTISPKAMIAAMALFLLLGACANGSRSLDTLPSDSIAGDESAYAKYEKPVILNIGYKIPDNKLAPGETNDNNPASRYFERITNIKVVHAWEAKGEDAYHQKVNLAIASNDIPDAMVVDRNQLKKLIDAHMAEDLTHVYDQYGSQLVQSIYDSTKGSALREASSGGKLYGLPNVAIEADSPSLLWVRQDWLERLNLRPPRTLDDLERIARAFIEQDPDGNSKADTVGLSGYKQIVYGQKPGPNGFDTIFNAYHAFPKDWIEDSSGQIVYGSITPQNKAALSKLADWYQRGLIDRQFALYKETQEPIVANKSGLFFGPWWMPYWPLADAVANDMKAEWRAYAVPLDAAGQWITHAAPTTDRFLVVRKGYPHPEAVVKLLNVFTRLERRQDPHADEVKTLDDFSASTGVQIRNYYPFDLLLDYANAVTQHYEDIRKAFQGEADPALFDPDTRQIYDQWMAEKENPKKNMDGWKVAKAYEYGVGTLAQTNMLQVRSVFYGTTPTMETKWEKLRDMENETFLKIIVGNQPVSAFDDFTRQWKQLGGDEITREVAQIAASNQLEGR